MTIYLGYCRVSTEKQSLQMQLALLTPLCGDRLWHEKKSGMSQATRTELTAIVAEAKRRRATGEDVVICVYSLSRLGRRLVETVHLIEELQRGGIGFKSLTESFDTTTAMGKCFFNIMVAMNQMEAELISERTIAGLQARKAAGVKLGPKNKNFDDQVEKAKALINDGESMRSAAKAVNMSSTTLARLLKTAA
jgi:DNA invertase Pin-like site-specific DNA recombinase